MPRWPGVRPVGRRGAGRGLRCGAGRRRGPVAGRPGGVPDRPRARPGRDGRGVRGRAGDPRPQGRAEGLAVRRVAGPEAAPTVPGRGAGGGAVASPSHRPGVRGRERPGDALLRHAVHRGPDARGDDPGASKAGRFEPGGGDLFPGREGARGRADFRAGDDDLGRRPGRVGVSKGATRGAAVVAVGPGAGLGPGRGPAGPPGGRGPGACAFAGRPPPRREAGESHDRPPGRPLDHRLRPRPVPRRPRPDPHRRPPGHPSLYEPGAGPRQTRGGR